jgi:hypothetical protein
MQLALFRLREKRFREAGLDFAGFRLAVLRAAHAPVETLTRVGYLDGVASQWSVKRAAAGATREWVAMFPPHRTLGSAHYKRGNSFEYLASNRFLVF